MFFLVGSNLIKFVEYRPIAFLKIGYTMVSFHSEAHLEAYQTSMMERLVGNSERLLASS